MTTKQVVTATVPAKTLLAGEYSILSGGRGFCVALSATLQLSVRHRSDLSVVITSNEWATPWTGARHSTKKTELPLVDACFYFADQLELGGFEVNVRSQLPISAGLGSSSAIRLATASGLYGLARGRQSQQVRTWADGWKLAEDAWQLQRRDQSIASGYDVACQLQGGAQLFQLTDGQWPPVMSALDVTPQNWAHWFHLVYNDVGAPTGPLVRSQSEWFAARTLESAWRQLHDQLADTLSHLARGDREMLPQALELMAEHRKILESSPANCDEASPILDALPGLNEDWGYKTTGAGGPDALLLVGEPTAVSPAIRSLLDAGWKRLAFTLDTSGATCEWNDL